MATPKRGEVWRVDWSSGKQGTEFAAGKWPPERACLVVSHDRFFEDKDGNRVGDRLTIVPFTEYKPRKEVERPLWSVVITNRDDVINRYPISDEDEHPDDYPEREQLEEWVTDENGNFIYRRGGAKIPYQSIIDCGQLWTIYATSSSDPFNDLRWDRRYGELKPEILDDVDTALQIVVSGAIHSRVSLDIFEGSVLEISLPERNRYTDHTGQYLTQRCLVVSSSGINAIREKQGLGHCTVVPLEPEGTFANRHGEKDIIVYPNDKLEDPNIEIAKCVELYTIDWRSRYGAVVGYVNEDDMRSVRLELFKYLSLPQ